MSSAIFLTFREFPLGITAISRLSETPNRRVSPSFITGENAANPDFGKFGQILAGCLSGAFRLAASLYRACQDDKPPQIGHPWLAKSDHLFLVTNN